MSNGLVQNFFDIFKSKKVADLITRELKKYSRARRRKIRMDMFMGCQWFEIFKSDIKKEYSYNEVYNGYFTIYAGFFIAEQFAPTMVMEINIHRNNVDVEVFLLE